MSESEQDPKPYEPKVRDWSQVKRSPRARYTVWLTPEQDAYVKRQAEAAGVSLSEYMRSAALAVAPLKSRPRLHPDRVLCGKMLAEMGKIGSNLNQIARALNQQQGLTLEDYRAFKEAQKIFSEMAAIQLKALGRD